MPSIEKKKIEFQDRIIKLQEEIISDLKKIINRLERSVVIEKKLGERK
tara:strand:- start:41 stop:184 length:144 start_codon:yes stop_codon:yes gene_type:complete